VHYRTKRFYLEHSQIISVPVLSYAQRLAFSKPRFTQHVVWGETHWFCRRTHAAEASDGPLEVLPVEQTIEPLCNSHQEPGCIYTYLVMLHIETCITESQMQ
jgi:hypothetical protein